MASRPRGADGRGDEELLYLYRLGDDVAFNELQRRYEEVTRMLAFGVMDLHRIADFDLADCFSECAMVFYRSLWLYDESFQARFSTYVYRRLLLTMKRKVSQHFNYQNHYQLGAFHEDSRAVDPPQKLVATSAALEDLYHASTGMEKAVIACLLSGMTTKEMMAELNGDERQVRNALYRIRKKLRKSLQ